MDTLYSLSNVALIVLGCSTLIVSFLCISLILRHTGLSHQVAEDIDIVSDTQGRVFSICSLVLAFSLVQVNQNFREVEAQVETEALKISDFDRLLLNTHVPSFPSVDARKLLMGYAEFITTTEWRAMAEDLPIDLVNPLFAELTVLIKTSCRQEKDSGKEQDDKLKDACKEMMKGLELVADARNERIELNDLALPGIFWGMTIIALTLSVTISALIAINQLKLLIMGFQVFILGLLLSVVYINDKPFKGETSVSPRAIQKIIATMKVRTG